MPEKTAPVPTLHPLTVRVLTDNLRTCRLVVESADGLESRTLEVPNDGNVYQGLHAIRPALEALLNDLLLSTATFPPAPEATPTAESLPETQPEATA